MGTIGEAAVLYLYSTVRIQGGFVCTLAHAVHELPAVSTTLERAAFVFM